MKTAMQELLSEMSHSNWDRLSFDARYEMFDKLLDLEKEQIIQAYQVGGINNYDNMKFPNLTPEYFEICGEEYFVKHYNNEIL